MDGIRAAIWSKEWMAQFMARPSEGAPTITAHSSKSTRTAQVTRVWQLLPMPLEKIRAAAWSLARLARCTERLIREAPPAWGQSSDTENLLKRVGVCRVAPHRSR